MNGLHLQIYEIILNWGVCFLLIIYQNILCKRERFNSFVSNLSLPPFYVLGL
jgi:hypothetical protein